MLRIVERRLASLFAPCAVVPSPKDGDVIKGEIKLTTYPQLNEPFYVKFAFTQHPLFKDADRYRELTQFVPKELAFVEKPDSNHNCFSLAVEQPSKIDRFTFQKKLDQLGYKEIQNAEPQGGDIVCYYFLETSEAPSHVAIVREVHGESVIVESRWGEGSPVMRHPISEILPEWMDESSGYYSIFRKNAQ